MRTCRSGDGRAHGALVRHLSWWLNECLARARFPSAAGVRAETHVVAVTKTNHPKMHHILLCRTLNSVRLSASLSLISIQSLPKCRDALSLDVPKQVARPSYLSRVSF